MTRRTRISASIYGIALTTEITYVGLSRHTGGLLDKVGLILMLGRYCYGPTWDERFRFSEGKQLCTISKQPHTELCPPIIDKRRL